VPIRSGLLIDTESLRIVDSWIQLREDAMNDPLYLLLTLKKYWLAREWEAYRKMALIERWCADILLTVPFFSIPPVRWWYRREWRAGRRLW
jgi:hypothetical protein